jgi:hypothetical protein
MATGRIPDPNSAPITAKGDLYTYSTVPARLAVGSNGDTLVADSAATTGLRWQGNFSAGKNAIINGNFTVAQRGTSFTNPASGAYLLDRWKCGTGGSGTLTVSQQSLLGAISSSSSPNYMRVALSSLGTISFFNVSQLIENVNTLAGQTVTLSFWAKADTNRTINLYVYQVFGSGGSSTVTTVNGTAFNLTTAWTRFTTTFTFGSMSGKTIGAGSLIEITFANPTGTTFTIDYADVQLEAGSVATAFQTATGTLQGELAACQRYYYRLTADAAYSNLGIAQSSATTTAQANVVAPVQMRIAPTSVDFSTLRFTDYVGGFTITALTLDTSGTGRNLQMVTGTTTGLTQYRPYVLSANNSTSAYIGFSAEL